MKSACILLLFISFTVYNFSQVHIYNTYKTSVTTGDVKREVTDHYTTILFYDMCEKIIRIGENTTYYLLDNGKIIDLDIDKNDRLYYIIMFKVTDNVYVCYI